MANDEDREGEFHTQISREGFNMRIRSILGMLFVALVVIAVSGAAIVYFLTK